MSGRLNRGDRCKIVLSLAPREDAKYIGKSGTFLYYTRTSWARFRVDGSADTILVHPENLRLDQQEGGRE